MISQSTGDSLRPHPLTDICQRLLRQMCAKLPDLNEMERLVGEFRTLDSPELQFELAEMQLVPSAPVVVVHSQRGPVTVAGGQQMPAWFDERFPSHHHLVLGVARDLVDGATWTRDLFSDPESADADLAYEAIRGLPSWVSAEIAREGAMLLRKHEARLGAGEESAVRGGSVTGRRSREPKWRRAQKKMMKLLADGKLPSSLRQTHKLIGETFDTTRRAVHYHTLLRAHFPCKTRRPERSHGSLLDELAEAGDYWTRRMIEQLTPEGRRNFECQLQDRPDTDILEMLRILSEDPDAGSTGDVMFIDQIDQDHRLRE